MSKKIIAGFLPEELSREILQLGLPQYRSKQILEWVYKKGILSFEGMKNLPGQLRKILEDDFQVAGLLVKDKFVSQLDNTAKYLLKTKDGQCLESVFIPTSSRATACVSTQAGCAFGCAFCASGIGGLKRNLTVDEIVSQVLLIKNDNPEKSLTNIVIMGMGEPFANYENTLKAVRIFNHPDCLGLAARKITISTCGLPPQIMRFAGEGLQVELSISLHCADDTLRSRLMPVNKKYPLRELIETAGKYTELTNRIVTFEYALIKDVNDNIEDAKKLADLLKDLKCKVNFITLNEIGDNKFLTSSPAKIEPFKEVLDRRNINYTFRKKRGADIKAACGQLRLADS